MQEKDTYFRPSVHGWPFDNGFVFIGTIAQFLEQQGLVLSTLLEFILVPRPRKLLLLAILNMPLVDEYGFCGGMTWAALDRFYRGDYVQENIDLPEQGEPLYEELRRRLIDSLPLNYILDIYDMQKADDTEASTKTKMHWQTLVKPRLDSGIPVPLNLVYTEGLKITTLFNNHQVIAYKYELDDFNNLTIWIYDPNSHHNDFVTLTMKITPNSNINASHNIGSNSAVLRGFLYSPYDRGTILPTATSLEKDESIGEGGYILLSREKIEDRDLIKENYRIKFKWDSNIIPYYSIYVDGNINSRTKRCDSMNGSVEVDVSISHLITNYSDHWIKVELLNKEIIYNFKIPKPKLNLSLYIDENRAPVFALNVPKNAILDAILQEVSIVEPDPEPYTNSISDQNTLDQYENKRIYVDGGVDPNANPNAFNATFFYRTVNKLGFIKKPTKIYCRLQASGFDEGLKFTGELFKVTPPHSLVKMKDFNFPTWFEKFELCEGFTQTDYEHDVYYRFQYSASDDLGQNISGGLELHAKSLLKIEFLDYVQSNIIGDPEWSNLKDRLVEEINTEAISFIKDRIGPRVDLSDSSNIMRKIIRENIDSLTSDQQEWAVIQKENLKDLSNLRKMVMTTSTTTKDKETILKLRSLHEKLHKGTFSMKNFSLLSKKLRERTQNKAFLKEVKKNLLKK